MISLNYPKIFKKINSKIIQNSFKYFKFHSCEFLEGNIVDKKINKIVKGHEILFEKKLSEETVDVLI